MNFFKLTDAGKVLVRGAREVGLKGNLPARVKGKEVSLPKCCIVYADGGFKLWHEGRYYGLEAAEQSQIVSYLEIVVQ